MTAVHGREPMKAPRAESRMGTAVTPQAMLMADQGTMPMRRRTERRTHAADLWVVVVGVIGEKEGVVRGG